MSNAKRNNPPSTELAKAFTEALAPIVRHGREKRRYVAAQTKVKKAMKSERPTQRGHPRKHIDWEAEEATLHGVKCFW
ncbi:MAG: hypothetical protein C0610_16720 [Desulfobacteraceae bacterium]|nr:MAG: hypothetical protein C0610_16720 [Desulfobacteraceae bacterium]